jgi:flagellar motor switch protein FliM
MPPGSTEHFRSRLSEDPQYLRQLRVMHEGMTQDLAAALSALTRTAVDVSLVGLDRQGFGRFICGIEAPACFYLLKADPYGERLMLDIEPEILHQLIDRLLGGSGADETPGRPLTDIEASVASRIGRVFVSEFARRWQGSIASDRELMQLESNPRLLRIMPTDEEVIVVGFELTMARAQGMVRFCIPCRVVDRTGVKLPADGAAATTPHLSGESELRAILAETRITAGELADLCVGDVIATETATDSPATVSVDGVPRFLAKPGTYQGRRAVVLLEQFSNEPEEHKP